MHSKLAVISGASKGIGRATAITAANIGMNILALGRDKNDLHDLEKEIRTNGSGCFVFSADLNKKKSFEQLNDYLKEDGSNVDLLVHSAGSARVGKVIDMDESDWRLNIDTNLTVPFVLTKNIIPYMKKGSHIIFINSVAGKVSFPEWSSYCATKSGLRAFADSLREELRPMGIKVTTVYPASVDTAMQDALPYNWDKNKMLKASEVAEAVIECYNHPDNVLIKEIDLENPAGVF